MPSMKLIAIVGAAAAAVTIQAGVGVDEPVRFTELIHIDLSGAITGLGGDFSLYTSVAGKIQGNVVVAEDNLSGEGSASASVEASAIFGGLTTGFDAYPSSFLANFYFAADADADYSAEVAKEKQALRANAGASLDAAAGAVGVSYLDLVELDAAGAVAKRLSLKGALAAYVWSASKIEDNPEGVHSVEHVGEQRVGGSTVVSIRMTCSDRGGLLSTGGLITPTGIEHLITIEGWEYTNVANRLQLRMVKGSVSTEATATTSANGYVDGLITQDAIVKLLSGEGKTQMFADFAENAVVDGNANADVIVDVKPTGADVVGGADVDGTVGVDLLDSTLKGQLKGMASIAGAAEVFTDLITVTFPAGAKKIIYDPTFGAGEGPNPGSNSAATTTVFMAVMCAVLAALL